MANVAQLRGLTFVLLGEFNPTIFHPAWFAAQGLLTELEAKTATVNIVHPDITSFELPWIRIQVERERFTALSLAQPYFEQLAGTVCDTFDILKHRPVRVFGVNNDAHFRASSVEKWHALGRELAPKEPWLKFFKEPGMRSLTIQQMPRPDGLKGHLQITVEPSLRIVPGVYIQTNDEIQYQDDPNKVVGASKTVELIREKWASMTEFSESVFSSISEEIV